MTRDLVYNRDFTVEVLHFSGRGHHDTKEHCQVCGARLPRRNHSKNRKQLCFGHSQAVGRIVWRYKLPVTEAVQRVKQRFLDSHKEKSA